MNSNQLRMIFVEYFKKLDHEIISSSSLIPENDPTLLFTNSGMVQFKNVFLGIDTRPYRKAVSIQKCMRASGKHNDLENVGYTSRHHTFFEMMGNFSFKDYFKREAISYTWRFLTEVLEIPEKRLWITVFCDDSESEAVWLKEMKINPQHLSRCGKKENFWQMGDNGPCGPCTEIFYNHESTADDHRIEICNLVFIQYNKDLLGKLHSLDEPSVDTGMGLERITAVMQGVSNNYDIELFQYLLKSLRSLLGIKKSCDTSSMQVIVDHIRSSAFLIADGVLPSNEGRGYVLRRIIRRAVRHGYKLGRYELFFYQLITPLIKVMGDAYPELHRAKFNIEQVIRQEEIQFSQTLSRGLKILDQAIRNLSHYEIPGNIVFQLYDTYGFPPDLTLDIAKERNFTIDYIGFNKAMKHQREQSKKSRQIAVNHIRAYKISNVTNFVGYETLETEAVVTTLLENDRPTTILNEGKSGAVVLDHTPFYAESGGQIGDRGYLFFPSGKFLVKDTKRSSTVYLHLGEVIKGKLHVKDKVEAKVNKHSRHDITRNHSATHLLHEALRRVLGQHIIQKGSLVEEKRLRFDFSYLRPVPAQTLYSVERLVNEKIRDNLKTVSSTMNANEAMKLGALFISDTSKKYEDVVRILNIGDFSVEACGGTHVKRTGEIGLFKIVSESSCASGVRRIEAVTGQEALSYIELQEQQLEKLSNLLKINYNGLTLKVNNLLKNNRSLEKKLIELKKQIALQNISYLVHKAIDIRGVKVLISQVEKIDYDTLRDIVDELKRRLQKSAIVLAVVEESGIRLISGVTRNCLDYFNAIELLQSVTIKIGGHSGGRPDMAQGGGKSLGQLNEALQSVYQWIKEKLQ
ncbi:alanine--tRNA ligase [Coxiella endosymbiont of Amblyomma americanum]|uniref:alanine--tRNA ligase n=1 Tax=Coxiella endosymbiont of Amblyomma americanum TaxID=325775 RepID=UPI00057CD6CF|nr:alanine--tRNA ligase [Coxiella endosymbiont of Amblyomma americanum]AJC50575.1 alanyl-tRNA synthetase [Coxiella endosymbiont of Amblyomma americanum]